MVHYNFHRVLLLYSAFAVVSHGLVNQLYAKSIPKDCGNQFSSKWLGLCLFHWWIWMMQFSWLPFSFWRLISNPFFIAGNDWIKEFIIFLQNIINSKSDPIRICFLITCMAPYMHKPFRSINGDRLYFREVCYLRAFIGCILCRTQHDQ